MSNWVSSLDMLSANGVLDYDGAAYLHSTPPRYIGTPMLPTSPQPLPPSVAVLHGLPTQDTFSPSNNSLISNPTWKKLLFAIVAGSALIYGGVKCKNTRPIKWISKQFTNAVDWMKKSIKKVRP